MTRRRRISSVLLTGSLVLGSVAAPLSHYLWMAAGSHYGQSEHAHEEDDRGRNDHADHQLEGRSALSTDVSGLSGCTYADLFATHVAGAPVSATLQSPQRVVLSVASADNDAHVADERSGNLTRGPPAA